MLGPASCSRGGKTYWSTRGTLWQTTPPSAAVPHHYYRPGELLVRNEAGQVDAFERVASQLHLGTGAARTTVARS